MKKISAWISLLLSCALALTAGTGCRHDTDANSGSQSSPSVLSEQSGAVQPAEETLFYLDYFLQDPGFVTLLSADGSFTDSEMSAFALLHLDDYDYENGNPREEYQIIARKYFGTEITDFDNDMIKTIPGTDRVTSIGWSFDSSAWMILKSLAPQEDGSFLGQFYCLNIADCHWEGADGEMEAARNALLSGDVSAFTDTSISLVEITFERKTDDAGCTYLLYRTLKTVENGLSTITPYRG